MKSFNSTFEYKLIYVFRINDLEHKDLLKIGEATCNTNKTATELFPNCKELNAAAKNRINQYTTTAGIAYELLYTEIAVYDTIKNGVIQTKAFSDHDVHKVLERSGIKRHYFDTQNKANEWFKVDLETAKKAIQAVKEGRASLTSSEVTEDNSPIIFRPEQKRAIKETVAQFKKSDRMLWNAKMRFGKTLTALQVAKEMEFKRTIILTHRPVVSDGWYEDFGKIFYDTDYVFGSKTKGEKIENLAGTNKKFVYFASMQDLRGSDVVGGKFDKNEDIFLTEWDFVVIDEAHEGTLTKLGQAVIDTIKELSKNPKILRLSGTPFNLLEQFKSDEIYTWDYVMEQYAKKHWDDEHFGDSNPYASLPELQIFTYNLDKLIPGYMDLEDCAFNFREFFRTWTGNVEKDFKPIPDGAKIGDFVHKNDVLAFLNLLCKDDNNSNYPFATEEYRDFFRHSLWMLPGVKEAKAFSALLHEHPVFGSGAFKIVNVAGDGDEEVNSKDALQAVRDAFGDNPAETYSITLSCGRLTTGVSVPEWTAVFMLSGTFSTSAANYMQTIFRVQTPANINGKAKERCCVFDFAPDRTLKMVAEAGRLSTKAGETSNDKIVMGEFLNFCPVIAVEGSNMLPYNVDGLLQQLKKAYTDRVVRNGFDDRHIYNDNLLKLDDIELKEFENLKKIVGTSKQTQKAEDIDVNKQGFTDEQYEELKRIEKKPKKELTEEDKKRLAELKEKKSNREKAISILRGISIRIPLIVYGADVPFDTEITSKNFTSLVDDASWEEFMPKGVTKETFNKFAKYYDEDIFISAGRAIRNKAKSADDLPPTERVKKIAEIFATFKNPDKETVLTPWRVVNMHLGDCLGGYDFFNEDHSEVLEEPRYVDKGKVTIDTLANANAQILEVNSKTGLYPLYVTYSVYRKRLEQINPDLLTFEKQLEIWDLTVKENLYVICKTPMARAITRRTLLGYRKGKLNAHAFDDLLMQLKEKPEQFREKILRGSFWNKEVKEMKFDAIVGNPPYQFTKNGNNEQIHFAFLETTYNLTSHYASLIQPLNWLNNSKLLNKIVEQVEILYRYSDSKKVFSSVQIPSGVGYTLIDKKGKFSETKVIENNQEYLIKLTGNFNIDDLRILKEVKFTTSIYGRISTYVGHPNEDKTLPINDNGDVKIWYKKENGKAGKSSWYTVDRKSIPNGDVIDKWKVMISNDGHAEATDTKPQNIFNNSAIALPPNYITTNRPVLIEASNREEAEFIAEYANTKFFRRLLHIEAKSNSIAKSSYKLVPDISEFRDKYDGKEDLDSFLNKYFNLSNETINDINKRILPKQTTKLEDNI